MEATSDYWKPFYYLLEDGPFEVMLVNARHVKNLPGRKPRSVPDGDDLRQAGLVFAEGRDIVTGRSFTDLAVSSLPGNVGFARAEQDRSRRSVGHGRGSVKVVTLTRAGPCCQQFVVSFRDLYSMNGLPQLYLD